MDRKAWIVVAICSILLAYNFKVQSDNSAILRKQQQEETAKKEAAEKAAQPTGETTTPGLSVERPTAPPVASNGAEESHKLETAETTFELSSLEGGIKQATFKDELAVKDLSQNVRMNDLGANRIGALIGPGGEVLDQRFYNIESQDANSIVYFGQLSNGLGVRKTWEKTSEGEGTDYRLKLTLDLINISDIAIPIGSIQLVTGSTAPLHKDERADYVSFFWQNNGDFDHENPSYFKGGFLGSEKFDFTKVADEGLDFAGVENQFFATIVDPADKFTSTVRAKPSQVTLPPDRGGDITTLLTSTMSLPDENLAPENRKTLVFDIFMGPKNNALIRSLDGEKDDVMNYGFFSPISRTLNWILNFLSGLFGGDGNSWSWGWAVVALTILIRTVMWPLHAKSTRTMKRMSKLQPKMKALKEKYPDDPNKMQQETMKLYREFGVNPMGGCLPLIFQIPVFFGFFTMLQYAVELRNEPFMWVTDLSQPDTMGHLPFGLPFLGDPVPVNILPILMAVTMVLQMKMTPKTGDKMQQRIMMFMPIMFFFFCYNFASALALYWTTQNIFSIAQTWIMAKMPEPELKTAKNAGKKTIMQKLAERAEEAQKIQKQRKKGGQQPGAQDAKPKKPRGPKTGG
ncbi:membrane protein insertase YidC [Akkermansiaceae bacterium]|nr:membrane protein insertase YidC [Akkermansiaceae bacterium]MDB4451606.1 membrane protein insertase YidC [Akkermansiaceae bacterium]